MAKLSANERAKLPPKEFGLPEKARSADAKKETGNYPMPDKGHAISAKRLSRKQRKDGNLTKGELRPDQPEGRQGPEGQVEGLRQARATRTRPWPASGSSSRARRLHVAFGQPHS